MHLQWVLLPVFGIEDVEGFMQMVARILLMDGFPTQDFVRDLSIPHAFVDHHPVVAFHQVPTGPPAPVGLDKLNDNSLAGTDNPHGFTTKYDGITV